MRAETPAAHWPPDVGNYARLRATGALGEVVEIERRGTDHWYALNLLRPGAGAPVVVELGDLEPVWSDETQAAGGRSWEDAAPSSWARPWPAWGRA